MIVLPLDLAKQGIGKPSDHATVRRYIRTRIQNCAHVWYACFYGSTLWRYSGSRTLASDIDVFVVFANDPAGSPNPEGLMVLREIQTYAAKHHVSVNMSYCDEWQLYVPETVGDSSYFQHIDLANRNGGVIKGDYERWVQPVLQRLPWDPLADFFRYASRQARWLGKWSVPDQAWDTANRYDVLSKVVSNHVHIKRRMLAALGILPADDDSKRTVELLYHRTVSETVSQTSLGLKLLGDMYVDGLARIAREGFDEHWYVEIAQEIEQKGIPMFGSFLAQNLAIVTHSQSV